MVFISFIGILIGSFSLTLVTAIMNGFEYTIHEKMRGIHAHIIIRGYSQELDIEAIGTILKNNFPEIESFSPSDTQHVIIQASDNDTTPSVAMIRGVDPRKESLVNNLEQKIITKIQPDNSFSQLLEKNNILIGHKLARDLGLQVGNKMELLYTQPDKMRSRKITLEKMSATVSGIFKTGIEEFDSELIICSLPFLTSIFTESGPTQLNIKLKPNTDEKKTVQKLTEQLKLEVYSWKDLYPALISALVLEKYVMFFILALITLVASMSIISLLFMFITQKRADIAILRAMGTSHTTIRNIFVLIGLFITSSASLIGIILASIASMVLERFPFITLPDAYYVSYLPVKMEWSIGIIVFVVILFIGLIATWIPMRKIYTINIANVLRFEG